MDVSHGPRSDPTQACAIAVMAKAPQPGRCKTRLVPPLTHEGAAALSAAFLRDVTENIAGAGGDVPVHGFVAYAPAGEERLFDGHLAAGTGLILADGSPAMPDRVEGFGRCLLHALRGLLALGYGSACLLNADSPDLPAARLREAAAALAAPGDRVVLGPAEDGGYYLIGLKAAHARPFEDVAWSSERVAAQTRARVGEAGLDLVELAPWYDVDDRAALTRLLGSGAGAAASRACLARLGLGCGVGS